MGPKYKLVNYVDCRLLFVRQCFFSCTRHTHIHPTEPKLLMKSSSGFGRTRS